MTNSMQELWGSSHLSAGHSAYLETLYEKYLNKPGELSEEWLEFFNNLPNASNGYVEISHQSIFCSCERPSRLHTRNPQATPTSTTDIKSPNWHEKSFTNRG